MIRCQTPSPPPALYLVCSRPAATEPHLHKLMQKLHTHTHTFIPLRHGFLSLGPFLRIAAGHTHPPTQPASPLKPRLEFWIPTFSPPSAPSIPSFLNLFLPPFIHLAFPGRRSNPTSPHKKRQDNDNYLSLLFPIFYGVEVIRSHSQSQTEQSNRSLTWTNSLLSFNLCFSITLISFSSAYALSPRGEPDRTADRKTETAGPELLLKLC